MNACRTAKFTAVIAICLSGIVASQTAVADPIDDYVHSVMNAEHIPGLALAVVKNGQVLKAQGYGFANMETQTPVTPGTAFRIGSMSKQFIASAIMLLVRDGKIQLDSPLSTYLADTPEAWSAITIREVLSHTAGLIREAPAFNQFVPRSDADLIKSAFASPLLFEPGTSWTYSNLGYQTLAEVILKVSGESWPQFIQSHLFEPAGMKFTRLTTATDVVPNRATGYDWRKDHWENALMDVTVRPSGAFLSTVLDMAKWDAALFGKNILNEHELGEMWTPIKLKDGSTKAYGFGWSVGTFHGHKQIHHDGAGFGFISDFERLPDDGLSVIVLTNLANDKAPGIAQHVLLLADPELAK